MKWYLKFPLYVLAFVVLSGASAFLTLWLLTSERNAPGLREQAGETEGGAGEDESGEVKSMPSVTGKSLDEAKAILFERGVKYFRLTKVYSDSVAGDTVIAQRPARGEPLKEPSDAKGRNAESVRSEQPILIVSGGPRDVIYYCPFFKGMSKEDAIILANELGLTLEFGGEGRSVKWQRPEPGSPIKAGSAVYLEVGGIDD